MFIADLHGLNGIGPFLKFLLPLDATSLSGKSQLLSVPAVALSEPLTSLEQLNDVHALLEDHDRSAGKGEDPRNGRIHLVRAGKLHCGRAEGAGEEEGWHWLKGSRWCGLRRPLQGWGHNRRAEAEQVQCDEEQLICSAGDEKNRLNGDVSFLLVTIKVKTYLVGVVQVHDPTPLGVHILVALSLTTHDKSCVHVHVVTCQIQRDQTLEDNAVSRLCSRQENEQAGGRASIGDHIQYSPKASALLKFASRDPIEGIEQAGNGV